MVQKIAYNCYVLVLFYFAYRCYGGFTIHNETKQGLLSQLEVIETKVAKDAADLEKVKRESVELDEKKNQYGKILEQIQELEKQVPSQILDAENLDLINTLAERQNIQNISLAPSAEEFREFYYAKKYEIKAAATFVQILVFLENLRNSPRLLNVTTLTIDTTNSDKKGRFQVVNFEAVIESYRYQATTYDSADGIEQRMKQQISG